MIFNYHLHPESWLVCDWETAPQLKRSVTTHHEVLNTAGGARLSSWALPAEGNSVLEIQKYYNPAQWKVIPPEKRILVPPLHWHVSISPNLNCHLRMVLWAVGHYCWSECSGLNVLQSSRNMPIEYALQYNCLFCQVMLTLRSCSGIRPSILISRKGMSTPRFPGPQFDLRRHLWIGHNLSVWIENRG